MKELGALMISLDIAEIPALFVLLAADGTVNRMGNGSLNNTDNDMYIGISPDGLFDTMKSHIDPAWLEHPGIYSAPDKKGKDCVLTLLFMCVDASEIGIQFRYGAESLGPPGDIRDFVRKAVEVTNPWHQQQKKMQSNLG